MLYLGPSEFFNLEIDEQNCSEIQTINPDLIRGILHEPLNLDLNSYTLILYNKPLG